MFAAGLGHVDCLKELVAHGADVNVKYSNGMTPLMYASMRNHAQREGHDSIVKFLISMGANE